MEIAIGIMVVCVVVLLAAAWVWSGRVAMHGAERHADEIRRSADEVQRRTRSDRGLDDHAVEPVRDSLLVRLIPEHLTAGGLVLPEGTRLKNRAQVVAVGSGHVTESGQIVPLCVRAGDFVIVSVAKGEPILFVENDPKRGDVVLLYERHIRAIDRRPEEPAPALAIVAPKAEGGKVVLQ